MNPDDKPWPREWCEPISFNASLRRLEHEIALHLRNEQIINDIKRRCGVEEKK